MSRFKLPLSSDQLELLYEFETAGSLEELSDRMAKDQSVISRRLQLLEQTLPVLIKESGRWKITYLGREINELSRHFQNSTNELIKSYTGTTLRNDFIPKGSTLVIINVQKALHYTSYGRRNNLSAEEKILSLLKFWRKKEWPVIHVKHISKNESSLFYSSAEGAKFIEVFEPQGKEFVFEKNKASIFSNSKLSILLKKQKALIFTGFTASDCIDASARDAQKLKINNFVISDATATFDLMGPNGKLVKAERIHQSVLANLHNNYSIVVDTDSII